MIQTAEHFHFTCGNFASSEGQMGPRAPFAPLRSPSRGARRPYYLCYTSGLLLFSPSSGVRLM